MMWVLAAGSGPRLFDPGDAKRGTGDTAGQIERTRIQRHLAHVEATLRAETSRELPPAQRAARGRALDALHAYWIAGEFPKNRDYTDRRVPYFIDDEGTACAVGQLMIASGDGELAREIATYENNDFVADIEHPGVPQWLADNGLSAAEAAWIQPAYGPCGFGDMPLVCGVDGNTYLCEYIATECAHVEIAHEGACGSGTSSGSTGSESSSGSTGASESTGADGSTGAAETGEPQDTGAEGTVGPEESTGAPETGASTGASESTGAEPEIIGEEICPAGTSSSEGGTSSESGTSNTSATSATAGESSGTAESGGQDDDDKGCSCDAGGRPGSALGALALLALLRRRRHR